MDEISYVTYVAKMGDKIIINIPKKFHDFFKPKQLVEIKIKKVRWNKLNAKIEVIKEEIEKEVKVFIEVNSKKLFEQLTDAFDRTGLETWGEDPWDPETQDAVYAMELPNKVILLFFFN